ncbi:twitching motility protein PilT [Gemmatimonadetes bacterium T265]|nr:twitching motility protein PilT [Gemmatimonadetes bacterium T265]
MGVLSAAPPPRLRILLDTHALVWNRAGSTKLSAAARAALDDPANEKFVSAATAWEVCTKFHLGKWPDVAALAEDFTRRIVAGGYTPLSVTTEHAQEAGALPQHHRDPFDRMLIAQALAERMPLVSNEALFDRYGVRRIW